MSEANMLEQLFTQYKDMTKDMIIKFKDNVNIDGILSDRKKVLEKISEISIPGKEKEKVYMELGIDKIDNELGKLIKDSANSIKEEIRISKLRRQSTNAYNNNFRGYNMFSRRV